MYRMCSVDVVKNITLIFNELSINFSIHNLRYVRNFRQYFIKDQNDYCFNDSDTSEHILPICWNLHLEEYGVTLAYLQGKNNVGTIAGSS
jgi:hypothetical protein